MQAYGSDRLREEDGRLFLSSRFPKGWTPRIERTLNQSEFPGTAVLWDGEYFEVVAAEALPAGVRYTLEPWSEHHMMRTTDRYDAESETHRLAERRAALAREQKRQTVGVLALFTGHLPAIVQERLASELGVLAARLTFVSLFSEGAVVGALVWICASTMMAEHRVPLLPLIFAGALGVETLVRYMINWTQSRPVGSMFGVLAYLVYWLVTGRSQDATPFEAPRGSSIPIAETPADRVMSDAMIMREPFATLLPTADQIRLRDRHGYDYHRAAPTVAALLLLFAILGVFSSISMHAWISLLVAAGIAIEQVVRLAAFRNGPKASVIGWIVRPFLRDLL